MKKRGPVHGGLGPFNSGCKRAMDLAAAVFVLAGFGWLILLAAGAARLDTGQSGFFRQRRIGLGGVPFEVVKIRTMRSAQGVTTTVTRDGDPRITRLGRILRKTKIDELPQFWNVLKGEMSIVGPRPDVPGYADALEGEARLVLGVRPGITGPATLAYRNEEQLLAATDDPERYNRDVIFPDKVRINIDYIHNYSIAKDIYYIAKTIFPI